MTRSPRTQVISMALLYTLALSAGVYVFTLAQEATTRVCLKQAARLELTRADRLRVCSKDAAAYLVGGV